MDEQTKPNRQALLEEALGHVRSAIDLCDRLGEALPACYLQHGLDVLQVCDASDVGPNRVAGRAH